MLEETEVGTNRVRRGHLRVQATKAREEQRKERRGKTRIQMLILQSDSGVQGTLSSTEHNAVTRTRVAYHLRHPDASGFGDVDELDHVRLPLLFRQHIPHLMQQRTEAIDRSTKGHMLVLTCRTKE